ncbi:MAG TPA: glycosyltransferase [Vicinamibacterales bacterium]|jgi:glycosyltransferase involved in cell wall biosynthesis|nr:glycosyltransferase [Vicinamibacterales bacterium]
MRIAVVTSSPPMAEGGHLVIARELTRALQEAGHQAHVIVTPQNPFGQQASAYVATWLTNVRSTEGQPIDQVISLRYPSYAVRHPRHVCWLNHTMREYYDLWDRFSATLSPQGRLKERARRAAIHATDRYLLTHNVNRLFFQSNTIRERYTMWRSLEASVLYPPAPQRAYRCDGYGADFFLVSRLTALKRADLLIRALAMPDGAGLTCAIAGGGDESSSLKVLARDAGVASRVTFLGRIDEDELLRRLSTCRAVVFPPLQEDYGFVTVEAFASRKAVVTCRDSGGPAELVQDAVTGLIVDPTPQALARALRRLADDRAFAERLGAAAESRGAQFTWQGAVEQLANW